MRLFRATVRTVCLGDYTREQVEAWAPDEVDMQAWGRSLAEHFTLVAVEQGRIVGFGDIASDGYLDRLYVSCDCLRRGVGDALCGRLERECGAATVVVHASVTARPFFERRGYRPVCEQRVERNGVMLTNYVMQRSRAGVWSRLRRWLSGLSFRTGVVVALVAVACYAVSFAQMLLPLPAAVKGVLWVVFFGLAKTAQYSALLILGKAGVGRLRAAFRRRSGR